MIEIMKYFIQNNETLNDKITNVIYLFYGKGGQKHIEASRNEKGINVVLVQ